MAFLQLGLRKAVQIDGRLYHAHSREHSPPNEKPFIRPIVRVFAPFTNFLVNHRMNKSQQMRWSRHGADLLLQVRCAVLNGKLGSGIGQLFKANPGSEMAIAA